MAPSRPIIADGQWHLYEWDLDRFGRWGGVPSIGGGHSGLPADSSHTVDAIDFRDLDGTPGPTATFFLSFVAKSNAGPHRRAGSGAVLHRSTARGGD